jgi:DNA replication protein DnaC
MAEADRLDPATQAHVDADRRPPEQKEPRKLSGQPMAPHARRRPLAELEDQLREEREAAGVLSSSDPTVDKATVIPASTYVEQRRQREHDSIVTKLDRIAPTSSREIAEGPQLVVKVRCSSCKRPVELSAGGEDPETPGMLRARMIAAGWLRTAPVGPGGCFSGSMCPSCAKQAEADEAEERVVAERGSRLSDACLPKAMQGFAFERMNPTGYRDNDRMTAISAARTWAAKERVEGTPGLLIFGTKGAGKTRLAATACWQRLRSHSCRWVSWPVLLGQLLASFEDNDRKQAMSVLNGTQALILDDIARDDITVSDWAKNQLFVAIDKRVQAGSPLLLTTNLTGTAREPDNPLAALAERLGDSIASRLAGYCRLVELPGEDQRLRFNFDGSTKKRMTKAEEEAAREGLADPEAGGE